VLVLPLQVLFATGAVLIEQWLTSLPAARALTSETTPFTLSLIV